MIHKNKKKEGGISPAAAVVTGAVIGAGAVVAGVAALRNEKNRAKAKKVLTQAKGYLKTLEKKAKDMHKEAETNVAKGKKEVKKLADSAKDDIKK